MKLITREIDYAVKALAYIAGKKRMKNNDELSTGEQVSITELVEKLDVPRPFMRKILQKLGNKGILKSSRGNRGGFKLVLKPEKIYLFDLIELFQGRFSMNECLFKKDLCPERNGCFLKKKIDSIEEYVGDELKKINLMTIMEGE
jgi:Rrf2 family protein